MNHDITEVGKLVLLRQKELSDIYKYKLLPNDIALNAMRFYVAMLPEGFHLLSNDKVNQNPEINETLPGYEIIKETTFPIVSRCETLIANKFKRVVIGHYGAFIEISDEDMYIDSVKCKPGQEYRIHDRRYRDKVKYQWFTARDKSDCNLYFQKKEVAYADYKKDMWYISPFEVLDRNELIKLLSIED